MKPRPIAMRIPPLHPASCRQGISGEGTRNVLIATAVHPPIMTVGPPGPTICPAGLGIGPTHAGWEVMSVSRAAGNPPIMTVADPFAIMPGPPGTQLGRVHGAVVSVARAAGEPAISTLACPLTIVKGIGGCGTGVGTGAAGWMGA